MKLLLIANILILGVGCRTKSMEEASSSASISIGQLPQSDVANDGFQLSVDTAGGLRKFANKEELKAAKFTAGETVTIRMEVTNAGLVVAKTIDDDADCKQFVKTLVADKNEIVLPLCLVDETGAKIGSVTTPPETEVDVKPCISGRPGCNTTPTDPSKPTDPAKPATKPLGACDKENADFKTAEGGCKSVKSGLIFSAISNDRGQFKKVSGRAGAEQYCSAINTLKEGGFSDWRVPTKAEVVASRHLKIFDHLGLLNARKTDGKPVSYDYIGEIYVKESKPEVGGLSSFDVYYSLISDYYDSILSQVTQFCVRGKSI